MSGLRRVEPINRAFSDGNKAHWPNPPYRPVSDVSYREKLADMWRRYRRKHPDGITYYLDSLPEGYGFFELPKQGDPGVVYKRLFGHPSGRFFDSTIRFWEHFRWLMDGGHGACECFLDSKSAKPPTTKHQIASNTQTEGALEPTASRGLRARQPSQLPLDVDENGTPDVFKDALSLLSKPIGRIEPIGIYERGSFEWRSERSSLVAALSKYNLQHSFIPRVGELVLWCPEMDGDLFYNPDRRHFMLYSFKKKAFTQLPEWRAGTVADVPEEPVDFQDLILGPTKKSSVNQAGFRIEMISDPNDDINKGFSRRYQYVKLKQIRPLAQWQTLLHGVPRSEMHPSIENALTLMSTISLVEKVDMSARRDKGSGKIWCQGAFLGSELLLVGDVIRFVSANSLNSCTEILCVDKILLRLSGITADHYEGKSPLLASTSSIRFVGRAYTLSQGRSFNGQPIRPKHLKGAFPYTGTEKWGDWYAMHDDDQEYEVSFGRVIGRLHEYEASRIWQGLSNIQSTIKPSLSNDIVSVMAARQYARNADARIPEGQSWFWADSRSEALALESLNGVELYPYDDSRMLNAEAGTFRSWEAILRIIDSQQAASHADRAAAGLPKKAQGRKPGTKIKDGKVVATDRMTAMAFDDAESESSESSGDLTDVIAEERTIIKSAPELPHRHRSVVSASREDIHMKDHPLLDNEEPLMMDIKDDDEDTDDRTDNDSDDDSDDGENEDPDDLLRRFKT